MEVREVPEGVELIGTLVVVSLGKVISSSSCPEPERDPEVVGDGSGVVEVSPEVVEVVAAAGVVDVVVDIVVVADVSGTGVSSKSDRLSIEGIVAVSMVGTVIVSAG